MADEWVRFAGGDGGGRPLGESAPYTVGVIANLSACTGCQRWRERMVGRFVAVDRDSLDELLARVAPSLDLDLPGIPPFSITAFEHFRPEGLATRIAPLAALLEARSAAGESNRPQEGDSLKSPPPVTGSEPATGLLDSLLERGAPPGGPTPGAGSRSLGDPDLDRLVRAIADASVDPTDPAARQAHEAAVDTELERRVRQVLHHPRFQALEAAWRSLRELVLCAETGDNIRLCVLDIAREDLLAELDAGVPVEATRLHRLVVEEAKETPGATPFSLLIADFGFGLAEDDIRLLHHFGAVAARADVPVLAGADTVLWQRALEGKLAAEPAWTAIQSGAGADRLALACPRILLRLPYGPDTDPVEGFAFDEGTTADTPERYCWGNPAFLLARAILESVATTGSAAAARRFCRFEGLPFHAHELRGEAVGFGPAERVLSDREIERLAAVSLECVSSERGRDSLAIRFSS